MALDAVRRDQLRGLEHRADLHVEGVIGLLVEGQLVGPARRAALLVVGVMVIRIGVWRGWARDQSRMMVRHSTNVRQFEVKSMSWTCSTLKPGFDIAAT